MTSRYPIRSRILKRDGHWLAILPTGRRVRYTHWRHAVDYAHKAVREERRFDALKDWDEGERIRVSRRGGVF